MGLTAHPQNELLALPSFQHVSRAGGISNVRAGTCTELCAQIKAFFSPLQSRKISL